MCHSYQRPGPEYLLKFYTSRPFKVKCLAIDKYYMFPFERDLLWSGAFIDQVPCKYFSDCRVRRKMQGFDNNQRLKYLSFGKPNLWLWPISLFYIVRDDRAEFYASSL